MKENKIPVSQEIKKHLLTGISWMIPLIVAAGICIALGQVLGGTDVGEKTGTIPESSRLALIPKDGGEELAYEFVGIYGGRTYYVYPRWRRIIGVFRRGVRIWVSLMKSQP